MSYWFFEQRDPRGVHNIPKHDEHFSHLQGIVSSLVRETSQNSGDASDLSTNKPARMRFRFGKIDAERLGRYLNGLNRHLASFSALEKLVTDTKTVRYLAIEDFETHGLRGSYDPTLAAKDSSYIAFWHRYGESGKTREHGGRHGLGKSTIASASRLQLFFGATVPSDIDPRQVLLQGQICLLPHSAPNDAGKPTVYDAYGLWYNTDTAGNSIPFIDKAAAAFIHDFNLDRGRSPGLSLVIPFPHEDLTAETIIRATIENCFHQILSKHLVVEVEEVVIDAGSVRSLAERYGLNALRAALDLSDEAVKGKLVPVSPRADAPKTRLAAGHFDDTTLRQMRKRWAEGSTVAVRLPVSVRERGKAPAAEGEVQLYIRREQDGTLARETYVRGRVSVPLRGMTEKANCVSLLVADFGIASTFLGDAEPPAHNRWIAERLRERYVKPDEVLKRIKYALRDLLRVLDTGEEDRVIENAFAEYLWSPKAEDGEEPRPKSVKKGTKTHAGTDLKIPPPKPQPHSLSRVEGGFAYQYQVVEGETDLTSARISVSYSRRTAPNKSKKKAKFRDFDGEMQIEREGEAIVSQSVELRRIVFDLRDVAPGCELRVTGFDANRDIELQFVTDAA